MEFFDYYLKGPDRDATRAALLAAGLTVEYADEDGEPRRVPAQGVNLSTVGVISTGGEWDAEGNVITPPTELPGWHVNLRLSQPLTDAQQEALAGMVIAPSPETPYRVWA